MQKKMTLERFRKYAPPSSNPEALEIWHAFAATRIQAQTAGRQAAARERAAALRYKKLQAEFQGTKKTLTKALEKALEDGMSDPTGVTTLYNRRFADEQQKKLHGSDSYSVLMIDIDHFKSVNDTYGHNAGDIVLREVGLTVQKYIRKEDIACRYGGEEFRVMCPRLTNPAIIAKREETLRKAIQSLSIKIPGQRKHLYVTVSVGSSIFSKLPRVVLGKTAAGKMEVPPKEETPNAVTNRADTALYAAKRGGRNRVRLYNGGKMYAYENEVLKEVKMPPPKSHDKKNHKVARAPHAVVANFAPTTPRRAGRSSRHALPAQTLS
jgi:diguanylate cyclase (GGDEF)-like protein